MRVQSAIFPIMDLIPILDEEFDRGGIIPSSVNPEAIGPVLSHDDLAWDDQLDNGEEMSL
jgi:hypothetical protein